MYFCFQILPSMFGNIVYQNLLKIKSYYNTMTLCIAFSQTVLLENCVQGNKVQETLTFLFLSIPWYTITQCVALTLAFLCGQEQRTRNESQRPREKFFGSRFISRAVKTECHLPRSFFAPKPNGNACYAGLALSLYGVFPGLLGQCIRQGSHLKGKENI